MFRINFKLVENEKNENLSQRVSVSYDSTNIIPNDPKEEPFFIPIEENLEVNKMAYMLSNLQTVWTI